MEITATITQILPLVTGQGKNGEWQKQEFIVETKSGEYTKKLCLSLWGDKIVPMATGQQVRIQFDIESREYNQRWYTECKAWKVEVVGQNQTQTTFQHPSASSPDQGSMTVSPIVQQQPATQQTPPFTAPAAQQPVQDDLPF